MTVCGPQLTGGAYGCFEMHSDHTHGRLFGGRYAEVDAIRSLHALSDKSNPLQQQGLSCIVTARCFAAG